MSRAYRITVKGSVSRVVHVTDGVCTSLELLPVLPAEQMGEILRRELAKRGFEGADGVVRRVDDGVVIEIDVNTGTLSLSAEATTEIRVERERSERVVEEALAAGTRAAQERLDRDVAREADATERSVKGEVTAKLEGKLRELRRELEQVTGAVTAEALKAKARSLGEIEELHEDSETGELTIKVRL